MALPVTITGISTVVAPVGPFANNVEINQWDYTTNVSFGYSASAAVRYGLPFTTVSANSITDVQIWLGKTGATDNVLVSLYAADSSYFPTGSALATATILNASIPTTTSRLFVKFAAAVSVSSGAKYVVTLERTGAINGTQYFNVGVNGFVAGYPQTVLYDGTSWSTAPGHQSCIVVGTSVNNAYYFFGRDGTTATTLQAFKSTAPDTSWASAVTKTGFTTAILALSAYQVGNIIHIAVMDGTLGTSIAHKYVSYDMARDTFLATTETILAAANIAGQIAGAGAGNSIVVRSSGEAVVLYNSAATNTSGTPRARISYSRRTAVNTWAAGVRVDGNVAQDNRNPIAQIGASDRVHFFFTDATNNIQRHLTSANVLGTASTAISGTALLQDVVTYDDAGTQRLVGVNAATALRFASADNPTISTTADAKGLPARGVDDLGTPYFLYQNSGDSDLYVKSSTDDGATWSSATNVFTGTVASAATNLSRNQFAYQRGSNVVFPYIVNDNGTLKYNEHIVRALTVGYTLTADTGAVTLAGVATGLRADRRMFVPASSDHWLLTSATNNNLGFTTTTSEMCQSFTAGGSLSSVTLYPSKSGTPPYSVVAKIYAADGSHFPTGAQIGPTSSNSLSNADLSTSPAPFTFVFPTPISLSAATEYALVLELVGTADPASIAFEISTSDLGDVYPGGAVSRKLSGVWTTTLGGTRDMRGTLHFTGPVAVAGVATGLRKGYPLAASTGTVAVTRYDVNLIHRHVYTLPITVGAVTVAFNDANLVKFGAKKLTADPGAITFAGYAAGLRGGRGVLASKGSVTLAGQAATLRHTHVLTAATGAVVLSGKAATLRYGHVVTAAKGAVTLAGQAATLRHATVMPAAQGVVTLTGTTTQLNYARKLTMAAEPGAVVLAGHPVGLTPSTADPVLTAAPGAVTTSGAAVALRADRRMFVPASSDHWLLTKATSNGLGFTTTTSEMCQSFTAAGSLSSVTLYPRRTGTPPYSVVAKIYAADASHFPTGAQIGPTSSNSLSSADLSSSFAPFTFVFPTPIDLAPATEYALVLELVGVADPASINFEITTSELGDVYPGGAVSRKLSGVWTTSLGGTRDMRGVLHFTGPVAVAGSSADLTVGVSEVEHFTLPADTGAVTVAGQAAGLSHGYVLQAAPSSQTGDFVDDNGVTSFIDDLGVALWVDDNGLILGGYGGPVAVTGYAATLTYAPGAVTDITLSADPGAVTVAGQAAILRYGYALVATQGAVTVTFNDANLKLRRFLRMIAAPGGIVLTGVPVGLSTAAHKSLAAVKGDIIVSRKAAELRVSRKLPAISAPILVTGLNVNLDAKFRVHYRLDIASGDIVVTGQPANLLAPYPKEKQPGPLVFGRRLVVIPGRW